MIDFYYPETFRGIVVSLLDKFRGMQVYRYNKARTQVSQIIDVPITFSPVEKFHQDRTEDYTAEPESQGRRYIYKIPRIALTLNSIDYAPDRAIGPNEYRYFKDNQGENGLVNQVFRDFQPAPYNFTFTLSIRADQMNDFIQLLENILPYFNPKLYLRVKEFQFLNLERDLQVILNSVTPDFTDELDKFNNRQMNGSVVFTVEGWQYRPVTRSAIVKVIHTRFWVGQNGSYADPMDRHISLSAFSANTDGTPSEIPPHLMSGYDAALSAYYYLSSHESSAVPLP